ncbi:hypothetical protein V5P93_003616 [Actinokineospora auranticolor]|uniref:Cupin domain-containing protein n=1 Tax=Actinokineospora auranticolor TaxID=155976 RepID=A0A2S6GIY4_9PSEU|nr:hypothetical protein [Actinokineospora auranticolor]PPK65179.1 hypothetical protein CLV40_11526 [Actinokineospora auranticolor]
MAGKYEKYIVRNMVREELPNEGVLAYGEVEGGTSGAHALISGWQVPGCQVHIAYSWIYQVPTPNPYVLEHTHEYDEVLLWMGSNPDDINDLGAVAELTIEGEVYEISTSASVYIPAGVRHCPLGYKSVDRPFQFIALSLHPEYKS